LGTVGANPQCHQKWTSDLFDTLQPSAVLALGDTQYGDADFDDYLAAYDRRDARGAGMSWGRAKAITWPVPGNHEYTHRDATGAYTGARGYFDYFNGPGQWTGRAGDRDKGYYSFDLTTGTRPDGSPVRWHLVALNSECASDPAVAQALGWLGGCAAGSPQEQWLRRDLAAASSAGIDCTLAFFHHPRFSAAGVGGLAAMAPIWQALYDYDADVVLSGHHHVYQRYPPLDPAGTPAPGRGVRQFVVGTGGRILGAQRRPDARLEAFDATSFGVLALTLRDGAYAWRFVPDGRSGTFADAGEDACVRLHATITSAPAPLSADPSPTFTFSASRAPATFACRLDGAAWQPCASPTTLARLPDGAHAFEVRAIDASGAPSVPAGHAFTVDTTPPGVAIAAPGAGSVVAGTVAVSAAAADAVGVARVELSADGVRFATDTAPPWSAPWRTRRSPDGRHRLVATAFDTAGNVASSAPVVVRVRNDRTAPRAALSLPPRPRLRGVLARGLRLRVRCSEPCRIRARLALARRAARRLGLPVRVGQRSSAARRGARRVTVPLARRARLRLGRERIVRLRLAVTVADASGNARTVRRRVVLG
jgi:Bacterial Ig domain/Calcineurin-like phosphoesterase